MVFDINNFFDSKSKKSKIGDFQDLDHINGISISSVSANLYEKKRDDLVLFYFRDGANYASVFTQSKIISENIKWNLKVNSKKLSALLINTRNANALTGSNGYNSLKELSIILSKQLSDKQKLDEEIPKAIKPNDIMFACTGTIGEKFPIEKIKKTIPNLIQKLKYTQNKLIWMKAALGIMTTDTKPKLSMSECKIGSNDIKIYGIAKGSGMIYPNMATTLGFLFTDANISSVALKKILKKNVETTFNAISCDGDTSTNDMVSIFSTNKANNTKIKNANDPKLKNFDKAVLDVLSIKPASTYKSESDILFEMSSEIEVQNYTPDFYSMKHLPYRMVIITSKSEKSDIDFVSRVFAPSAGIDEDPATGIAHCILGPLWAEKLAKQTLKAYQASSRGAEFGISLKGNRIHLFGHAKLILKGALYV